MKLYNSLSKKLEAFKPLESGKVKLYTCGPTVYDHVHIGNLRTYIFEDTLRRVLKSQDYEIQHVMNITDVDDKTIARSRQMYPRDKAAKALAKLAQHYEQVFYQDAKKVGIDFLRSKIVRATEHIKEMQELIRQIPNKYITDDGVYFEIAKDKAYGQLVKLDRSHLHHRISNDEYDKDHVADFALWKVKAAGEPSWEFEIDGRVLDGRPGWHIECSAMSVKYLGQPFDIHSGGIDLMFPHHENEIAQSRAATAKPLANYFIHGEHLLVDGHKMSKSLKNFYTLKEITKKGYEPLAFRLLVLQAHYRNQMNFTWEALDGAQAFLKRLQAWADLKFQPELGHKKDASRNYDAALDRIKQSLADDLNTAKALAAVSDLASQSEREGVYAGKLQSLLAELDKHLGLSLADRQDIDETLKQIIARREEARKNGDWAAADELRSELNRQKIEVNDTPHGPVWSRV